MIEEKGISRRGFMMSASALAGAVLVGGLIGCAPKNPASGGSTSGADIVWDEETDIVIVGYGGAGAAAALKAKDLGLSSIVLEKNSFGGGSTALSGQAVWVAGSSLQKTLGVDDSPAEGLAYYKLAADGREDLLEVVVEGAPAMFDWLVGLGMEVPQALDKIPGLVFGGVEHKFAAQVKPAQRTHYSTGLWSVLQEAVGAAGIDVRLSSPVTGVVADAESKTALGVEAEIGGKTTLIKANRGVLLAAGGYSRNAELCLRNITKYKILPFTGPMDDGDGLKMGQQMGAGSQFLSGNLGVPTYADLSDPSPVIVNGAAAYYDSVPPYILVNLEGKRFCDERQFYLYTNDGIIQQTSGRSFLISQGTNGEAFVDQDYHPNNPEKVIYQADSVVELAVAFGGNAEGLISTVASWNEGVVSNTDAFGRAEEMVAFSEGQTFYAREVQPGTASTLGGLLVDKEMRVLGALDEQPIPHLYAAGVNAGALGRFYPSCGSAVTMALVTGEVAARTIAADNS